MTELNPVLDEIQAPAATSTPNVIAINCSCILYLRHTLGVPIRGNAENIEPNGTPTVGGLILFEYTSSTSSGAISHAAFISAFVPQGYLVKEANFSPCVSATRVVKYNDPAIRGFWKS